MKKYNTKFSNITLAVDLEPEEYIKKALRNNWHVMKIFKDLQGIARRHRLKMVDRRTVYLWVSRCKDNGSK